MNKIPSMKLALEIAMKMHGDQMHGSLPIIDHLVDVANNVREHYEQDVNISPVYVLSAAAILHDILEDTKFTFDELDDMFGEEVSYLVSLVTDKDGKSRMERHLNTYHMIRTDPDAVLIKLCDRRHNHERSLKHGEHYMAMYRTEYLYFKFALYKPHQFVKLWAELDSQHEELKRRAS